MAVRRTGIDRLALAWRVPAWLGLLTLVAWLVVGFGGGSGFPLDDAWIHQVMARNLAHTGVLGFAPGVPGGGTTSVLWTLLLLPAHLSGLDPVGYTRLLALGCWVAVVLGVYALALEDRLPRRLACIASAATACTGNAVWLAWSGMEAPLASATIVWAVVWWRRQRPSMVCGCLAAAVLTRPELAVPAALVALCCVDRRSRIVALGGPVAAAVALVALSSWTTGRAWPATLAGRRWLYGVDRPARPGDVVDLAVAWLVQLGRYTAGGMLVAETALLVAVALGLWALIGWRARGWQMLVACVLLTLAAYAAVLPRIGHAGRYQPLVIVLALPLAAFGVWTWAGPFGPRIRDFAAGLVAVAAVPSLVVWQGILSAGIAHINATERGMGRYLARGFPPDSRVAAFDIGGIAWELPGRVVDLSGLSDGDLGGLRAGRLMEKVAAGRAEYVALPFEPDRPRAGLEALGLAGAPLRPVHTETSDEATWARAFGPTAHAWRGQMLYRVERVPLR